MSTRQIEANKDGQSTGLALATGSVIGWRSCAQWPDGLLSFAYTDHNNTTTDRHDTEAQAEGVCTLLRREGLGGERIHFPLKTWTEPVYAPNTQARTRARSLSVAIVRRLSASAWGWEIARSKDAEMLAKCHEDNCRSISQLAHELGQARDAERLVRMQLANARETLQRISSPNTTVSRDAGADGVSKPLNG